VHSFFVGTIFATAADCFIHASILSFIIFIRSVIILKFLHTAL